MKGEFIIAIRKYDYCKEKKNKPRELKKTLTDTLPSRVISEQQTVPTGREEKEARLSQFAAQEASSLVQRLPQSSDVVRFKISRLWMDSQRGLVEPEPELKLTNMASMGPSSS